jgi:glutathione S-transferase
MLEIHGKRECPFAWRVRLAAREKDAPYEWIPYDVASPDARAAHRNPDRRSPLLWDAGFALTESLVIAEYIEESCRGRALLPSGAQERAQARLLLTTLVPEVEARGGHAALEAALRDGREWLTGAEPMLPDLMIWPFLSQHEHDGAPIPPELGRARRYWERAKLLPVLTATRP